MFNTRPKNDIAKIDSQTAPVEPNGTHFKRTRVILPTKMSHPSSETSEINEETKVLRERVRPGTPPTESTTRSPISPQRAAAINRMRNRLVIHYAHCILQIHNFLIGLAKREPKSPLQVPRPTTMLLQSLPQSRMARIMHQGRILIQQP